MVGIGIAVLAMVFSFSLIGISYAQVSEQTTISGDLENNPVAQEILQKIEKSKRWIENIQKRDAENLEKQKELEEKRAEVLRYLENDLKKWEDLWDYYTFDSMLERALANNPANSTDAIYDHPLKFTASKINAGRAALSEVIANGGGPEEARDAFVESAKISRAEMLSANILFNVINENAYYNQQILFESDGQFNDDVSGNELRKYYKDYRTNPQYLQANPFDKISWEDLGKNNPTTECRDGYTLVYRHHAEDYVCTTQYTAEMWVRHNMGVVVDENFSDTPVIDIKKLERDRTIQKVDSLNLKVQSIQAQFEQKMDETTLEYESLIKETMSEKVQEEKDVLDRLNKGDLEKDVASKMIIDIREDYFVLEEHFLEEKSRTLEILEKQHLSDLESFVNNYEHDNSLSIIWNSATNSFESKLS